MHVEHGHERRTHDEVRDPLECHSDSDGSTTDGVGEDLCDEHPGDGSPREHERGRVDEQRGSRHKCKTVIAECNSHAEGTEGHTQRTADEQWLASPLLDGEHSHQRERNVDDTHEDRQHHRVVHTHITEDTRCIVEHGVDTHSLLEHREHDADEDTHRTVGHQFLRLHYHRVLDILQDLLSLQAAVDLGQDTLGLLVLADRNEITRGLRHKADEQCEESCRHSLRSEHVAPACGHRPLGCGIDGSQALTHLLHQRLDMVAQDEEVHKVDHQLTEDDGELVPRDEHTSYIRRRHLADIHRADGRSQAYSDTADHTIEVEHDEK